MTQSVAPAAPDLEAHGEAVRFPGGWAGAALSLACFALGLLALTWTQVSINTTIYRVTFVTSVLGLVFAVFPLRPKRATEHAAASLLALGLILALALNGGARTPWAAITLGLAALGFIASTASGFVPLLRRVRIEDWIFAGLALAIALYLSLAIDSYKTRPTRPSPEELALGGVLILLVLEATRRAIGWILPAIALLFLLYAAFGPYMPEPFDHRGFSFARIIGQNAMTLEGIFSTPSDVAATFIILFTIYGAVLDKGGAGRFFINWAFALFGRKPSPAAPGRAVVSAGFLLGSVSGSGVATTVTLTSIAWPMLRQAGYAPHVAGGMLAASGIGATLSPPTLGAAAFIIAEYLKVDYLQILIYAAIPTLLYYWSCWLMNEADARRLKASAIPISSNGVWALTKREGYQFLSLAAIGVCLIAGFTSFMAVFWSIAVAFALSIIRPETRLASPLGFAVGGAVALVFWLAEFGQGRVSVAVLFGMIAAMAVSFAEVILQRIRAPAQAPAWPGLPLALRDGTAQVLAIAATCATAGIIVSVVNLTGLGLTISSIIVSAAGGERLLVILLAALAMWVLGTAIPVTASYILAAVMLAPALIEAGVPEPAAHMFLFYYAVLADVSPPTALAPFAAAAIVRAEPFSTMLQAWKYTLPAFLVPIMFCLTPEGLGLLALTPAGAAPGSWAEAGVLMLTLASSLLALAAIAAAATGYAFMTVPPVARLLAGAGGLLLLAAGQWQSELAGLALVLAALAVARFRSGPRDGPAPG